MIDRTVLEAAGPFYHITTSSRATQIMRDGLRPDKWDEGAYGGIVTVRGPFVCLTPSRHRDRYVNAIRNRFEDESTVLLEIATNAIVDNDVELDCTTTELQMYSAMNGTSDPAFLLEVGVPLMCYDPIPPESIKEVCRFPALKP